MTVSKPKVCGAQFYRLDRESTEASVGQEEVYIDIRCRRKPSHEGKHRGSFEFEDFPEDL